MTRFLRWLGSMPVAIASLLLLMVLVVDCTLAQVRLGTFGAVDAFMRVWWLWWNVPGTGVRVPVFPGGAAAGALLAANLVASMALRLERSRRKAGLWLAHAGILLLVGGEFSTGTLARESNLAFEVGEGRNWTESQRHVELVIVDHADPARDRVAAISDRRLARGGQIADPRVPLAVEIKAWYPNAQVVKWNAADGVPPAGDRGPARFTRVLPLPPVTADDAVNAPAAVVGLAAGGTPLGTWLVAADFPPQSVAAGGKVFELAVRPERQYLPFVLGLKEFRHDIYPGTDIPKNFASLVRLQDPERGQDRDVLIWMNHPLRYRGLTFYQASFGKDDRLSILQVVRNPGWRLPYLACALVAVGLAWHFLLALRGPGRPA